KTTACSPTHQSVWATETFSSFSRLCRSEPCQQNADRAARVESDEPSRIGGPWDRGRDMLSSHQAIAASQRPRPSIRSSRDAHTVSAPTLIAGVVYRRWG